MLLLLCIILFACSVALWLHVLKTRRLLSDLEDALRAKRRFLPEISQASLRICGIQGLVHEINDIIDRHRSYAEQNSGYSKQVEAMLSAVKEIVIIFNTERVVEYANKSAEDTLRNGQSLKGLRIESVLRSSSLMELLDDSQNEGVTAVKQVQIEHEGESLWFEASCGQVRGIEAEPAMSTLLVLYDITRLQKLEVMRREFVANVSHELRTPLTIIKGFAETLVDDYNDLPEESRSRFLGKILNNSERLHVLVEDLLTLSRLESKPDQLEPQVQPLKKLFEEIAEDYRSRLLQGEQVIEIDFDDAIQAFAFDRFRINQVLDNLVENCFRYAPEFTKITLKAQLNESAQLVECQVIDNGPGISEKDLPHLFERFYRVDKGRSRERGGTGLGLSIVKHIVQIHGGSIHAQSELGQGTAIHFSLPYVQRISHALAPL